MMKLTVTLLSCACCLAIEAAVSPYQTASDYVFQPPALTNLIRGVVIGDEGGYGTMRYEDIAFLNEAIFERKVLLGLELNDNASLTNHLNNVATNPPLSSARITSRTFGLPSGHFLATNAVLATGAKLLVSKDRDWVHTNHWEGSRWHYATNVYPAVTNVIEQTMTNMVKDVYTNIWPHAYTSNIVERYTATNVGEIVDSMFEPRGMQTLADDARIYQGDTNRLDEYRLFGPYSMSQMTNLYSIVRDMKRSVPRSSSYGLWPTNAEPSAVTSWSKIGDNDPQTSTNKSRDVTYSFIASVYKTKSDSQQKIDGEWISLEGYPIDRTVSYRETCEPANFSLRLSSGVSFTSATWRASSPRIPSAQAFALVNVASTRTIDARHSSPDGTVVDATNYVHEAASAVVPLGKCDLLSDPWLDQVAFAVDVSPSIYRQAADVSSIDFVNASDLPSPAAPSSGDYVTDVDDLNRTRQGTSNATVDFNAFISDIYIILTINPSASLQGWNK